MDFKEWHKNEELKLFRPEEDPQKWTNSQRACKYCRQPVTPSGSYSGGESRWARCKNLQCPSQKKHGLLEPEETIPNSMMGKIATKLKIA